MKEIGGLIISPLLNVAGVVRAVFGVIEPKLYLKAAYVSDLSEKIFRSLISLLFRHGFLPGIFLSGYRKVSE